MCAEGHLGTTIAGTDIEGSLFGGRGWCTHVMHGRSRVTIDPRVPIMPGRSTSGFHRPGRHCLHQARSRQVLGESHEGRAASFQEPLLRQTFFHVDGSVQQIEEERGGGRG